MKKILLIALLLGVSLQAENCRNLERKADAYMNKADRARYSYDAVKFYAKSNFWMNKTVACQNRKIMKELRRNTPSHYSSKPLSPYF